MDGSLLPGELRMAHKTRSTQSMSIWKDGPFRSGMKVKIIPHLNCTFIPLLFIRSRDCQHLNNQKTCARFYDAIKVWASPIEADSRKSVCLNSRVRWLVRQDGASGCERFRLCIQILSFIQRFACVVTRFRLPFILKTCNPAKKYC